MMDDPSQMEMFDLITCQGMLIDVHDAARIYRMRLILMATRCSVEVGGRTQRLAFDEPSACKADDLSGRCMSILRYGNSDWSVMKLTRGRSRPMKTGTAKVLPDALKWGN